MAVEPHPEVREGRAAGCGELSWEKANMGRSLAFRASQSRVSRRARASVNIHQSVMERERRAGQQVAKHGMIL